jgi:hypothetical protein
MTTLVEPLNLPNDDDNDSLCDNHHKGFVLYVDKCIDGHNHYIYLQSNGTWVAISKDDFEITSDKDFNVIAANKVNLKSGGDFGLVSDANMNMDIAETLSVGAVNINAHSQQKIDFQSDNDFGVISGGNMNVSVANTLNIDAVDINAHGQQMIDLQSGGDFSVISGANMNMDVANILNIDAAEVSVSATGTVSVSAPEVRFFSSFFIDKGVNVPAFTSASTQNFASAIKSDQIDVALAIKMLFTWSEYANNEIKTLGDRITALSSML